MACLLAVFSIAHGQQLIQYENSRVERDSSKIDQEREVPFEFYSLRSDTLDLRPYKENNPKLRAFIQDKYPVKLPDLSAWRDTAMGVCYLTWGQIGEGDVVIFLVGNRNSPSPAYYFDQNLDYDFTNDGGEFHFRKGERRMQVKIVNEGWRKRKYSFWLLAPEEVVKVRERMAAQVANNMAKKEKKSVIDEGEKDDAENGALPSLTGAALRMELGLLGGGSHLGYRYINWRNNMPTTYDAYSTEKGLLAGLEFRSLGFRARAVAGFEHAYYWSSQKLTQLGEPYWLCDSEGNCTFIENRIEERNAEVLPNFRMTISGQVGYAIDLGSSFTVQPILGLAWETYFGRPFVPAHTKPEETFAMPHAIYFQPGGQFDFRINENSALFLRGTYLRGRFEPKDYYDQFDIRTKTSLHRSFRFELGVSFGVW